MRRRLRSACLLGFALACAAPAAAPAATVSYTTVVVHYTDPPGTPPEESCSRYAQCDQTEVRFTVTGDPVRNDVTVTQQPDGILVRDAAAALVAEGQCRLREDGAALCPPGAARIDLGAGDDRLVLDAPYTRAAGGAGDDVLVGASAADELRGGPGDDRLIGGRGADLLIGGAGRDVLRGGAGDDRLWARDGAADVVSGGAGRDGARLDRRDRVRSVERRRYPV